MHSTNFDKVCAFQARILGNEYPLEPRLPPDPMHELRCLQEEIYELATAVQQKDLVEAADAIADLIYFAYGMAYKMGLPMNEIFGAVHDANMTKVRGMTKRGHADDAAKPEGWQSPEVRIRAILHEQARNASFT